ncbi:MAG: Ig-like domain-containing protein [Vicinamibacterales bacterium]
MLTVPRMPRLSVLLSAAALSSLAVVQTLAATSTLSTLGGTSTVSTVGTFSTLSTVLQPSSRLATSIGALLAAPIFFHGRQIVVRCDVEAAGGLYRLVGTPKPVYVFWSEAPALRSGIEVRGEFWDVGRLQQNDPRFSSIDLKSVVDAAAQGQWPARGQVFVITGASAEDSPLPAEPTIRALALAPEQYAGHGVTVTGRFRGANLYADLPQGAGTKGRWDFVLQSADAAVWVSGVRPKGKDFDLDVNSRIDTGRWLQVTGTVRREGALPWIEATAVTAANAPAAPDHVSVAASPIPAAPPPSVIFTMPIANDTDVDRTGAIKIQFSRDMDPASFKNHVRLSYVGPAPAGAPANPPPYTAQYVEGSRGVEIKCSAPLDRFRTVKVDLLDGITADRDKQPLAAWSMTFTTGG